MRKKIKNLLLSPEYKIGDIVVYKDRYEKDMGIYHQSKIVEAVAYLEENDKDDIPGWFYQTEETLRTKSDNLATDQIIGKLKI